MKVIWGLCLVLVVLLWGGGARAGVLADRISSFPNWDSKPPISVAKGDLIYPNWMAGNWNVASTLVDLAAPLAPNIVTPGFEGNRRYLQQPVLFKVRFQPENNTGFILNRNKRVRKIVADRTFNGLNIAKAYLGDRAVLSVKVDPTNPNRQITVLKGEKQLISIVTARGTETLNPREFVSTEISQQVFRGESDIYLNEVETTTSYQAVVGGGENSDSASKKIEADQVTAIYLSPQDPNYFTAGGHPVALYRYRLELMPS